MQKFLARKAISLDDLLNTLDDERERYYQEHYVQKNDIFFDSSALIAGIVSAQGAARALLLLAEDEKILITVSEQVIAEVERNIARKAPKAVPFARELILRANIRILRDPPSRGSSPSTRIGSAIPPMCPFWSLQRSPE